MKKMIYIRFDMPGVHCWKEAPEHLDFLQHPHRHIFKFEVGIIVNNSNRELEFFETQSKYASQVMNLYAYTDMIIDFEGDSCEMIAEKLLASLPDFVDYVEVSEDGENGACIWR